MARSASFSTLFKSLDATTENIRISGLSDSSTAYFVYSLQKHLKNSRLLVLCENNDVSQQLLEDVQSLHSFISTTDPSPEFLFCPEWEVSPYEGITPSLKTANQRASAQYKIISSKHSSPILFSTLGGSLFFTPTREEFNKNSFSVFLNKPFLPLESIRQALSSLGYIEVDSVEDVGTFSLRGNILDVFPPQYENPFRVELFDDTPESIRVFDPNTQKSLQTSIHGFLIYPSRDAWINEQLLPRFKENLKTFCDENEIQKRVRDQIIEKISQTRGHEYLSFWVPFLHKNRETIVSLFGPTHILYVDEPACLTAWEQSLKKYKTSFDGFKSDSLVLPSPASLFLDSETFIKNTSITRRLFVDKVSLLDPTALDEPAETPESDEDIHRSHFNISSKTNTDLSLENKIDPTQFIQKISSLVANKFSIYFGFSTTLNEQRLRQALSSSSISETTAIHFVPVRLSSGFRLPKERIAFINDFEVFGVKKSRSTNLKPSSNEWSDLKALSDLNVSDLVVHIEHGIGVYRGITRITVDKASADFLILEYANKDKLYLPVYRLNVIQKYFGSTESVSLDKLGSSGFSKTKEEVKAETKKIALNLIELYAERSQQRGLPLSRRDSAFSEFSSKFIHSETPDQLKAIEDSLSDMESGKIMDRVVCGDVGFGKTEVAMRAAFHAVHNGYQVAVLVPTTILAHQHERSFLSRFSDYPIKISALSRFKDKKEISDTIQELQQGKVDIVIGTHRLLSKDVKFKNLGLIIVDEEHRFGVEHKEKLKTFKLNAHVLTLTATPIPRTLHMSLSGLREISIISSPPVDRLPIRTYIAKFDESLIQRAIQTELSRGGQVFFVHNRVQSIHEISKTVKALVPHAKIGVAHGQLLEGELEEEMLKFYKKETDVLICTSIIESGLDVPSANTIIVNRADAFGLAQLYQIRGRVGRGQARAFAYFLIPSESLISNDAKKRLDIIQRFIELGSGFSIASHDLEIRGGGDLLGPDQSGHIAAVGFELYTELLEEAINEARGKPQKSAHDLREPEIKIPFSAYFSEEFIPDVHQRLSLYRRLSGSTKEGEISEIEMELTDRFGKPPPEAENLLWLIRIKQLLKHLRVDGLTVGNDRFVFTPGAQSLLDPVRAIALASSKPEKYTLTPDSKFIIRAKSLTVKDLFFSIESLLKELRLEIDPSSNER